MVSIEIPKNTEIEIPEDIQSGIYLLSVAGIESNPGTGARTFHKSVYLIMLQTNGLAISSSNPCIEDFTNDFSSIFNIDNNLKIKTNNISYNSTLTLCKVGIV